VWEAFANACRIAIIVQAVPAQGLVVPGTLARSGRATLCFRQWQRSMVCRSYPGIFTAVIEYRRYVDLDSAKDPMAIRLIILASLLATIPLDALARDHGQKRDHSTITALVIHTVGGPACIANMVQFRPIPKRDDDAQFWQNFLKAAPSAEAHYVIGRNGTEAQVMSPTEIAYHTVGINDVSIGIELVHRGDGIEPFEEPQILKLIELIKEMRKQFPKILISNIVAHGDIDQRICFCGGNPYHRRQDPGANFPMQRVIDEVRVPSDGEYGSTSLPRLTGPTPGRSCASYSH
jgi:N-acetylmuramoyl-L-alanine amidase